MTGEASVIKVVTIDSNNHTEAHKKLKQDYDKRHPDNPLPELGFFDHTAIHNLLAEDFNETGTDYIPTVTPGSSGHIETHNILASAYNVRNGLALF